MAEELVNRRLYGVVVVENVGVPEQRPPRQERAEKKHDAERDKREGRATSSDETREARHETSGREDNRPDRGRERMARVRTLAEPIRSAPLSSPSCPVRSRFPPPRRAAGARPPGIERCEALEDPNPRQPVSERGARRGTGEDQRERGAPTEQREHASSRREEESTQAQRSRRRRRGRQNSEPRARSPTSVGTNQPCERNQADEEPRRVERVRRIEPERRARKRGRRPPRRRPRRRTGDERLSIPGPQTRAARRPVERPEGDNARRCPTRRASSRRRTSRRRATPLSRPRARTRPSRIRPARAAAGRRRTATGRRPRATAERGAEGPHRRRQRETKDLPRESRANGRYHSCAEERSKGPAKQAASYRPRATAEGKAPATNAAARRSGCLQAASTRRSAATIAAGYSERTAQPGEKSGERGVPGFLLGTVEAFEGEIQERRGPGMRKRTSGRTRGAACRTQRRRESPGPMIRRRTVGATRENDESEYGDERNGEQPEEEKHGRRVLRPHRAGDRPNRRIDGHAANDNPGALFE